MAYQVHQHVYCCQAGDHVVLLDLRRDSYFLLRKDLEHAFLAHINGLDITPEDRDKLSALGVLSKSNRQDWRATSCGIVPPSRSAVEGPLRLRRAYASTIIEVGFLVYSTRKRLRRWKMDALAHYRPQANPAETGITENNEASLIEAADAFANARRFVPIETSCLLDSLALHNFLSRRQLSASIVLGVTTDPFSAHAWLQSGNLALNETVSHAVEHTPIMVL